MDNNKGKQHNLAVGQTAVGASSITPLACPPPSETGEGAGLLVKQTAVVRWWLFTPDDVFPTSHVHTR